MSISLRLALWFSAAFMLGYLIFGMTMYVQLSYSLAAGRDKTLLHRAERATALLKSCHRPNSTACSSKYEDFAAATPEGNLIYVFDANGKRLYPVAPDPRDTFPWPASTPANEQEFSKVHYGDGTYRMLSETVTIDSTKLRIVIGGQLKDNRILVAQFKNGLLWATPVFLLLSALFGYFLSIRALHPVGRLIESVRLITIGNLSRRLPTVHSGDELEALTDTCNEMLERLDTAVGQIKRFTADASHELRSPVSYIYTLSECALRNSSLDEESAETFAEIVRECKEATDLLDDMLSLARRDSGHTELVFVRTNLTDILNDVCVKAVPFAERKQHSLIVDLNRNEPAWIMGDASSLRRLFWIMLDNAIKYTPSGGEIRVRLQISGAEARIYVQDSGIGIPQGRVARDLWSFLPSRQGKNIN
jgi:signal transduction histidine kinase